MLKWIIPERAVARQEFYAARVSVVAILLEIGLDKLKPISSITI